eukprot:4872565-Lingulodinium_polyedra.AAC.3
MACLLVGHELRHHGLRPQQELLQVRWPEWWFRPVTAGTAARSWPCSGSGQGTAVRRHHRFGRPS